MAQPSIPAVLVGVTRATALDSSLTLFDGTPYYVAAVLDSSEASKDYHNSPRNLGLVLYALHPRPQILVTGTAIDAETVAAIQPVWDEHRGMVAGKSCWIAVCSGTLHVRIDELADPKVKLSKTHGQPGPPPPGIGEEVMKQLDAVFRPEVKG